MKRDPEVIADELREAKAMYSGLQQCNVYDNALHRIDEVKSAKLSKQSEAWLQKILRLQSELHEAV